MPHPRTALNAILSNPWAITDEGLEQICAIAAREHEFAGNTSALEARLGKRLDNKTVTTVRGSVGILEATGPMFRRANLMTELSGATSYEQLALDFTSLVDNQALDTIVLKLDTTGGEVTGLSQMARLVFEARDKKKIIAYVDGTMASAGFWIGAGAHKIYAADTALVGSIGVQMGLKRQEPRAGEKAYTFISSQSPNKNLGPETESGSAAIQKMVNDLAQVFVDTVAQYRGITSEDVLAKYGQGGVFVAADALERGMIDGIYTFEQLLSELNAMDYSAITIAGLEANRPEIVSELRGVSAAREAEIRTEAAAAERARQAALDELAVAGAEDLIAGFKADGTAPEVAAMAILKHVKTNPAPAPAPAAPAAPAANPAASHLAGLANTDASFTPPAPAEPAAADSLDATLDAAFDVARKSGVLR